MPWRRLLMKLSKISEQDIAVIKSWRAYPEEFKDLDYALRDTGWIDQFSSKEETKIYTGEADGVIVGFTILSRENAADSQVEFRIALNPDVLGQGIGRKLAQMTIEEGFRERGLHEIYLIVRKNNRRARMLYEHIGFRYSGECSKEICGTIVDLFKMTLDKETFKRGIKG
jgi:diamine N-acetyltransferase